MSDSEATNWQSARWNRERVVAESSPLPNARFPWRFEANQSCTLINDPLTGQRHEIFSQGDYRSEDHGYCFSPDGEYLVGWFIGGRFMFPVGGDQTKSHIRVWDVATGRTSHLVENRSTGLVGRITPCWVHRRNKCHGLSRPRVGFAL